MPTTPNFGFTLGNFGDTEWHIFTNGNWTLADTAIQANKTELVNARSSPVYTNLSPFANLKARIDEIEAEIKNMRGNYAAPTNRLSDIFFVGHDADGNNLTGSFTFDQWSDTGIALPAYLAANKYQVDGNQTAALQPGTSLRVIHAISGTRFFHVKSATYNGGTLKTEITLWDDETAINESITSLRYGPIRHNEIGTNGLAPGSSARSLQLGSFTIYRYDASSYDDPFNTTGGRVATSNTGIVAFVEFASGYRVGFEWSNPALPGGGELQNMTEQQNGADQRTWTVGYTGDLITSFDMAEIY